MSEIQVEDNSTKNAIFSFENLKPEEIVRGATPKDIDVRCLTVCKAYLAGSWLNAADPSAITVSRISGGLTNQIYRVQLNDSVPRVPEDEERATDVAIKFYMPKLIANFNKEDGERLNDNIVLTILSELDIGPKVYGIFGEGVVQEYFDHVIFGPEHQQQPELVRILTALLARVHHLQVPIRKDNKGFTSEIIKHLDEAYGDDRAAGYIEKLNLKLLAAHNVRDEYTELMKRIEAANMKLVFCHNDFRGSNILVSKRDPKHIVLTDLEYASFGYRGSDLANYLFEWGKPSLADIENRMLPEDESITRRFIQLYIEGCDRVVPGYSNRPENSVEQILKEVKLCALMVYMFGVAFMLNARQSFVDILPFDAEATMKFCETLYGKYFEFKKRLIEEGVL